MAQQAVESERHPWRQIVIDLAVMTLIGLVLAVVGPLGTFGAPFAVRLIYWLGLGWAGYAFFRPISGLAMRLAPVLDLPEWPLWLAGCVIATVPMTGVVMLVNQLPGPFRAPRLDAALTTYGYVLAIGAAITMLFYALQRRSEPARVTADGPPEMTAQPHADSVMSANQPTSAAPRIFARIASALGTDLIALEMEDHYLRVHTALGSELVLLRMRDALGELDGLDGAQVHRSWWVARGAVQRVERDGRNLRLVLTGGITAPVARNMAPVLKRDGWI